MFETLYFRFSSTQQEEMTNDIKYYNEIVLT